MAICRICLKSPADKDIARLEKAVNKNKTYFVDVMIFCLDIDTTVMPDVITTNLCDFCYRKIISFYRFKTLALKSDVYLKTQCPAVTLVGQEKGMKSKKSLNDSKCDPSIAIDKHLDVKDELDMKYEDVEYIESDQELEKLEEEVKVDTKDNVSKPKKRKPSEKIRPSIKRKPPQINSSIKRSGKKPKMCEQCGKVVLHLKLHSVIHRPKSERNLVQCKVCPKMFQTRRGRQDHYKKTHLGFKFECDICHKKVSCLSAHKQRVHEVDTHRYRCVLCERRFYAQDFLARHMLIHTGVRDFECDDCHKKFRTKDRLSKHIRQVHQKERTFQCHLCPKTFFEKFFLDVHIRTHTKERPFECTECGLSFSTKDRLKHHQHIHIDGKPVSFACKLCDKTFATNGGLKQHLMTHSALRAFRCHLCDKSFKRQSYLTSHMVAHTREKKYLCGRCGARFPRPYSRARHERACAGAGRRPRQQDSPDLEPRAPASAGLTGFGDNSMS